MDTKSVVKIELYNNLHLQINTTNRDYLKFLHEYFSDYVDGYQFMPAFNNSAWDGKVSLFNLANRTIPYGVLLDIIRANSQFPELDFIISDDVKSLFKAPKKIKIKYNLKHKPHPYQKDCIEAALTRTKGIIRSATASGKSLVISYIIKTLEENKLAQKTVIIVPTTSLVEQFHSDMIEYGFDQTRLGRVYEKYKDWQTPIVISTWQTLSKNHVRLKEFDCIICDETHQAKSHEIKKILAKTGHCTYRLGFTGTLYDTKLDLWNVKAYLGPILKEYGAGLLGDMGYISKCNICTINIDYHEPFKGTYDIVKDAVFNNTYRMNIIKKIINRLDSNVLLLVGKVEKEGEVLKKELEQFTDRKTIFIHGGTKVEEREYWRKECEKRKDLIIIATYGVFAVGINIPSLKYIIFASPFKSKIRILQSIGRSLRKHVDKIDGAYVFDILDTTKYLKEHGIFRARYYDKEGFDVKDVILLEGDDFDCAARIDVFSRT